MWREEVFDRFAELDARMKSTDERLASLQKAMELNKEAIDKAMAVTIDKAVASEKGVKDAVGSFKTDVEKAMGNIKDAVGSINTDMKDNHRQEISTMEKELKAEMSSLQDKKVKSFARMFYVAIAVFIFGQPMLAVFILTIDDLKRRFKKKNFA